MRKFLSLLGIAAMVGLAYALGAKAGHGRYQEIRDAASSVWNDPKMKKARKRAGKNAEATRQAIAKKAKKLT
jgi:hypothetical protein